MPDAPDPIVGPADPGDPPPDPRAADLVRRALDLVRHTEAMRLDAYIEAGRLLRDAKALVGHGHWLIFIDASFRGHYSTVRRILQLADGLDEDSWLAEQIHGRTPGWSVEKAIEYIQTPRDLRTEMREAGVVVDRAGERRIPLAEAGRRNLRHHKRFAAGKVAPPDPILLALAKAPRFIPPGTAREMVDGWTRALDDLRGRMNLSGEDPGPPEALDRLVLSLSALSEAALGFRTVVHAARTISQALRQEARG